MTPLDYYQQQLNAGLIQQDDQQTQAIHELQHIHLALFEKKSPKSFLSRLFLGKKKPIKGLYLWGSVGVGKTFLMDTFYHCLPEHKIKKMRLHFHQFMQRIHEELTEQQGHRNPLQRIARKLSHETEVLCFDEFLVTDIADAMILAQLFEALFNEGLCLITNANLPPDDLYREGLQRERFLPAIEQIKKHTTVLHMTSKRDYRVHHIEQAGVYHTPLNRAAEKRMEQTFQHFSKNSAVIHDNLVLFGRAIPIQKRTEKIIWFDFNIICYPPRSQKDYIALTKQYDTVLISGVPVFKPKDTKSIAAFINLVDVFYDARVRLVLSAGADVESLYPAGELIFDFARTQSRLIEMQSEDYYKGIC